MPAPAGMFEIGHARPSAEFLHNARRRDQAPRRGETADRGTLGQKLLISIH